MITDSNLKSPAEVAPKKRVTLSSGALKSALNFWTLWDKARVGCFERTACILSIVKQITSPGWMHETSAQAWCTGKTQRNRVEREVGGGRGMGNTCNPMADSCQCMTKPTEML